MLSPAIRKILLLVIACGVVATWSLFLDLYLVHAWLLTHTETSTHHVVDILGAQTEFSPLVARLDSLGPDDDLTAVTLTLVLQVAGPGLGTRSHELTHGALDITDFIVVAITVSINYRKSHLLLLFEEVGHVEAGAEVGVERVLDLLSLAKLHPGVVLLLKEEAQGVRLAEGVKVAKLASRDEQVDLH